MNLEEFKDQWQQDRPATPDRNRHALERLDRQQRQSRRQRRLATGLLLPTMVFIAGVWWTYRTRFAWPFDLSIGLTELLIAAALVALWRPVAWPAAPAVANNQRAYLERELRRLRHERWVARWFMPAYVFLLGLFLGIYAWEIFGATQPRSRLLFVGIQSLLFGIGLVLTVRKSRRRLRETVDPMIEALEEVYAGLAEAGEDRSK